MVPIVGEEYWWKVWPNWNYHKYIGKVVKVIKIHPGKHFHNSTSFYVIVDVIIVESNYKGEIGLTVSTTNDCLFDLASEVVALL